MRQISIKCDRCGAICEDTPHHRIAGVEVIVSGDGAMRNTVVSGKDLCRGCYIIVIAAIKAAVCELPEGVTSTERK
jgi:hypothetical protein